MGKVYRQKRWINLGVIIRSLEDDSTKCQSLKNFESQCDNDSSIPLEVDSIESRPVMLNKKTNVMLWHLCRMCCCMPKPLFKVKIMACRMRYSTFG